MSEIKLNNSSSNRVKIFMSFFDHRNLIPHTVFATFPLLKVISGNCVFYCLYRCKECLLYKIWNSIAINIRILLIPALEIHWKYPSNAREKFSRMRSFLKVSLRSTRVLSLLNSLQRKNTFQMLFSISFKNYKFLGPFDMLPKSILNVKLEISFYKCVQ